MFTFALLGAGDAASLASFYARLGIRFKGEGRRFGGSPYRVELFHLEIGADIPVDLRGTICHGVNDVAAGAALVEEHGGTVLQGPLEVGGRRMVAALDPAGNPFGLFELP